MFSMQKILLRLLLLRVLLLESIRCLSFSKDAIYGVNRCEKLETREWKREIASKEGNPPPQGQLLTFVLSICRCTDVVITVLDRAVSMIMFLFRTILEKKHENTFKKFWTIWNDYSSTCEIPFPSSLLLLLHYRPLFRPYGRMKWKEVGWYYSLPS